MIGSSGLVDLVSGLVIGAIAVLSLALALRRRC